MSNNKAVIRLLKKQIGKCKRLEGRLLLENDIHKCVATEKNVTLIHEITSSNSQTLTLLRKQPVPADSIGEPTEFTKGWRERLKNAVTLFKMGRSPDDWFQSIVAGFYEACVTIDCLAKANKTLAEKHRWILVSEPLPKIGQLIISIHIEKKMRKRLFIWSGIESDIRLLRDSHTHWKPIILPKQKGE